MNHRPFTSILMIGWIAAAAVLPGCSKKPAQPAGRGDGKAPKIAKAPVPLKLSAPVAETEAIDADHLAKVRKLVNGGLGYMVAQREVDGGWSMDGAMKPAITAMVLKCLLQHPDLDVNSPVVKKGFDVLLSYRQKDGAIFDPKQGMPAYSTSIAVMAMAAAKDPKLNGAIRQASDYLKGIQIKPGQESPDGGTVAADSPRVGGVGYGRNGEPNLSVLGFAMEAWHDAGVTADDESMKMAIGFLSRLQNRSESNPMPWAREGAGDGGYVYDLKTSKAGSGPEGRGLRSYGSMTYVGFKSMLYAGVDRNDPRVQGAYMWIRRHWRLDSNPNLPTARSKQGLFYYYHVFAKALRVWGVDEITDLKQVKHNWRHELIDALSDRAAADGSWVNTEATRWDEGNPILATCFAVMALQEALRK